MIRRGCESSQITPTYRFSRSYNSLTSVRSVDGSPWRGSRCQRSPIGTTVDHAGSSRTPSTTIGVSILLATAIRGCNGGVGTEPDAALKTTAAISVTSAVHLRAPRYGGQTWLVDHRHRPLGHPSASNETAQNGCHQPR